MKREVRSCDGLELRAGSDDQASAGRKIVGYAAKYDVRTDLGYGVFEEIAPGAFDRALQEAHDVRALINHDANLVLGRTAARTLALSSDEVGLSIEIDPPDTQAAKDLRESIARGDVNQMSFMFRSLKDEWTDLEDGNILRRLFDLRLYDVSVVTFPAYEDTEASLRELRSVGESRIVRAEPGTTAIDYSTAEAKLRIMGA